MTQLDRHLLTIRDLQVSFDTDMGMVQAVKGLNLSLKKGEALGLVGETGAGKTTAALSIMQLIPDPPGKIVGGEILFAGENIILKSEGEKRHIRGGKIAMIFQDPMTSLNPVMTVGDQIAEMVKLHTSLTDAQARERAGEMLQLVGIRPERGTDYPHQFSGGMKQRVVIAIALACSPQLLIADEPTTALDVTIQAQVLELMRELKQQFNTATILISHDLGVVAEICDTVAIMYAGRILEKAPIELLYNNPVHPYTKGLFNSIPDITSNMRRLNTIPGLPPDPINLPAGCPFEPRCEHAGPQCSQAEPPSVEVEPEHYVSCFKVDTVKSAPSGLMGAN